MLSKKRKKEVGLQVSTPPFSVDTFFSCSINQIFIVSKLTADVFCTSLWHPPGYIARRLYVHITFILQSQPTDNKGVDVICWRDLSYDGLAFNCILSGVYGTLFFFFGRTLSDSLQLYSLN
jgi:hypothetical protein